MYQDKEIELHVENIISEAASFIVASDKVDFKQLWAWMENSQIIEQLREGNVFVAYFPVSSLVFSLLNEMGVLLDDSDKKKMLERIENREGNLLALWVTKTEWQVTQRLDLSYQEIHKVVNYNDICNFFAMYHVFIDPITIIEEVYNPLLKAEGVE